MQGWGVVATCQRLVQPRSDRSLYARGWSVRIDDARLQVSLAVTANKQVAVMDEVPTHMRRRAVAELRRYVS